MTSLRLVSSNIERAKHYERVFPFLKAAQPDVICLLELFERDIPRFEAELGATMYYTPTGLHPTDPPENGSAMEGSGILTRHRVLKRTVHYFAGSAEKARTDVSMALPDNRAVTIVDLEKDGVVFTIALTHFTWAPNGGTNDDQQKDIVELLNILDGYQSFALCGDFNAPRGKDVFSRLAERYKDNIPPEYTTSIDKNLHRAGALELMVDGLFTTKDYVATNVRLQDGVSDHMAIVAEISKV